MSALFCSMATMRFRRRQGLSRLRFCVLLKEQYYPPLRKRAPQSPPNRQHHSKKTRGPNRTTKCASWCEAPPPRFHALARFGRLARGSVLLPGCLFLLLLLLWSCVDWISLSGLRAAYKHRRHECGGSRCSVRSAVRPGPAGTERGSGGDADGHSVPRSRSARRRRGAD